MGREAKQRETCSSGQRELSTRSVRHGAPSHALDLAVTPGRPLAYSAQQTSAAVGWQAVVLQPGCSAPGLCPQTGTNQNSRSASQAGGHCGLHRPGSAAGANFSPEPACDRSHGTPHSADGERRGERTRRMASAPEPLWGLAGGLLSSSSWQTRLPTLRTPSHPASAQRASASVPIPTTVQGQAGWGFEQPALAEGVSPTGRGAGTG
ncbi:uncharacterized protein LOC119709128 isoform X3 [Motacilla alba alba]|uniref:uncharacterized protein LOC119709128 isoform X3 n=1 Tax=Motacilla alba alba TaxID=1094192 RepID=UPI0018D5740F|nr:uncharacterized protein LOC119709128 isoform X3 [Motacilla alba alba]